jgi:hypothetical protein
MSLTTDSRSGCDREYPRGVQVPVLPDQIKLRLRVIAPGPLFWQIRKPVVCNTGIHLAPPLASLLSRVPPLASLGEIWRVEGIPGTEGFENSRG